MFTRFKHCEKKSDFLGKSPGVQTKAWATYFLYPRKLVYDKEKETNHYYKEISHVAIANYGDYSYLEYEVKRKKKYDVLPVRRDNKL